MSTFNSITITNTSTSTTKTFVPAELKIDYDSLSGPDSGRSMDGTMHINWLKSKLVKLEVTLPPHKYNDTNYNSIFGIIQGQSTLSVTFWDYMDKQTKTLTMYCSQTSAGYTYKEMVNEATFELIQM